MSVVKMQQHFPERVQLTAPSSGFLYHLNPSTDTESLPGSAPCSPNQHWLLHISSPDHFLRHGLSVPPSPPACAGLNTPATIHWDGLGT